MPGYSRKRYQHSVGKLTVVYNVHIYYAMATILVACVFLFLKDSFQSTYLLVLWYILRNGINTNCPLKKSPLVCVNSIPDSLWVYCRMGYSGKWHQHSVEKFTLVYNFLGNVIKTDNSITPIMVYNKQCLSQIGYCALWHQWPITLV